VAIQTVPNHIAIIPDGNRRWAKKRSLKPWLGHQQGFASLIQLLEAALTGGVGYVTFWGASMDNLTKRSKVEVKFLLEIIKHELFKKAMYDFLHKYHVRVRVVGEWRELVKDDELKAKLNELENLTANYKDNFLTILFAYDGKHEMLKAINASREEKSVGEKELRKYLDAGFLPDVDLVIRTGGQPHWSAGFLMWLTANSEFYFTETLWPDFNTAELKTALGEYAKRLRKMGT